VSVVEFWPTFTTKRKQTWLTMRNNLKPTFQGVDKLIYYFYYFIKYCKMSQKVNTFNSRFISLCFCMEYFNWSEVFMWPMKILHLKTICCGILLSFLIENLTYRKNVHYSFIWCFDWTIITNNNLILSYLNSYTVQRNIHSLWI
jgi:hypothetical protein